MVGVLDSSAAIGKGRQVANAAVMQVAVPPGSGGVADYARLLAEAFGPRAVVRPFSSKDRLNAANGKHVFIQYSGYGYAKRGAPLWLIMEVQRLKREGCTVGIFFHEIYASGPPWRSSFWLSPLQKWVARRLVRLADYWMTNRDGSYEWLQRHGHTRPSGSIPICSTIGESKVYAKDRKLIAVIFGSAPVRSATYKAAGEKLILWARSSGVAIHDIGPPVQDPDICAAMDKLGVIRHGRIPPADVCEIMRSAQFGLVAYPGDYVAKSSVFAAYCAHGLCPILLSERPAQTDLLLLGENFLNRLPALTEISGAVRIARGAWSWYLPHGIEAHARLARSLMIQAERT